MLQLLQYCSDIQLHGDLEIIHVKSKYKYLDEVGVILVIA